MRKPIKEDEIMTGVLFYSAFSTMLGIAYLFYAKTRDKKL